MCFSGGESAFFQNLDDTIYLNDDTASGSLIFTVITGGPVNSTYMTTSSSVFVFNDTSSTRFNDKKPKPVRCIMKWP